MPPISCAILGTGPAALMAATTLTRAGLRPTLFERRAAPGWKLLVAGSSGLNVSQGGPEEELWRHYPERAEEMRACLARFPRHRWLALLEELGEEVYEGTSRRYFVRRHTAAALLKAWVEQLERAGARFVYGEELTGLVRDDPGSPLRLRFDSGREEEAKSAILALGGGSWEAEPPRWPELLRSLGVEVRPFASANSGWSFRAGEQFFAANEGKPVKGLQLATSRGERRGELMITRYGLEGTPVYTLGCPGPATLDLKPDLGEASLTARLGEGRGSVWQRVENKAKLSPGALALLRELAPAEAMQTLASAARAIKCLRIELLEPRPLSEAISSRGGISWDELSEDLEIKKLSTAFCAGEMIDWDAPTGGFLLQGAVSTGHVAAEGVLRILASS